MSCQVSEEGLSFTVWVLVWESNPVTTSFQTMFMYSVHLDHPLSKAVIFLMWDSEGRLQHDGDLTEEALDEHYCKK